jgi:hypothetical protein
MEGKGIHPASQWLGWFAKPGMNTAQPALIKKDTRPIGPMGQPPAGHSAPRRQRFKHGARMPCQLVGLPALLLNPPPLVGGDLDLVLTTAAAAIVAAPVLQGRQIELGRHACEQSG